MKDKIAIIGLGYVGLPLVVEFSKKYKVVGFDIDKERISELINNHDRTNEISSEKLKKVKNILFTSKADLIEDANIYIVTVPTPVDKNKNPDLKSIKSASSLVGSYLKKGDVVIYESTVFPGCTEEICVPILEKSSGLTYNEDFFCGYSPERINPGDKHHTLSQITKITSGSNEKVASFVDLLYKEIIEAGTFKATSIAVAEAAKVIENTQRDVNIALINELSMIFQKLGLDTKEVLDAAKTKWNFLPFSPGLVGGHCIGVDPYYLTHKATEVGFHPEIILAGRKINDSMGSYIVDRIVTELAKIGKSLLTSKVSILGLTFKEDCPDLRNTKVISIIDILNKFNAKVQVADPQANKDEALDIFGISTIKLESISDQDVIVIAVGHKQYKVLGLDNFLKMLKPNGIIIDIKSIYSKNMFEDSDLIYWRL